MEKFEQNCIKLANMFGCNATSYQEIPEDIRVFMEGIGHMRVCAIFVITDLREGKSERRVARNYGITRRQVQTIRAWNKRGTKQVKSFLER